MRDTVWESLIAKNLQQCHTGSDNHNYLIDIDTNTNGSDSSNSNNRPGSPNPDVKNFSTIEYNDSQDSGSQYLKSESDFKQRHKPIKDKAKRLLRKNGGVNFKIVNVEDKGERYVGDFFTTLVDVRWRWTLTYFTISYILSWFLFALMWWVIVRGHGDMDHFEEPGWKPCVVGVNSFSSLFLFSLETQHTIGYGYHRMSDECAEAIVLLVVQSIIGVIIESLTVGVFIVKLSRPKKRAQTVVFSKHAVITKKDDSLCLIFRVADVGKSMLLEAHIRAQLITKTVSKSGKVLLNQQALSLEGDDQDEDRLLLFWPTNIIHEIDEESPLYEMTADNFKPDCDKKFEIVVVLEGIVESTGMTTQARTSYLPSEIFWGHKFLDIIHEGTKYTADMECFHTTFPVPEMTGYSAKQLKQMEESSSSESSCSSNQNDD